MLTERVDEASAISWLSSVTMDDKVQLAFGRLQSKSDSPPRMKRPFASEANFLSTRGAAELVSGCLVCFVRFWYRESYFAKSNDKTDSRDSLVRYS